MKMLLVFWRFTRPHTIIGSTLSVTSLFFFASFALQKSIYTTDIGFAITALIAALACNLFITGINQISDLEIDRINKPHLPLASGEMTLAEAKRIVVLALFTALGCSFYISNFFGFLILSISLLGWSYSMPPIRFKRFHIWAASAIALVRGPLVNVGIALVFLVHFMEARTENAAYVSNPFLLIREFRVGVWMIPLTLFITAFSLGIAWFKDLPDTEGDSRFKVGTLAVRKGKHIAFLLGVLLVTVAYVFLILWGFFFDFSIAFNLYHIGALGFFAWWAYRVNLDNQDSLKRFYKLYWILFFLEYLSYFLLYLR